MIRILYLLPIVFSGCSSKIQKIEEQSSVIAIIILFASIAFLALTPKMQKWNFTKDLMVFFINKLSLFFIFIMIISAILFFINSDMDHLIGVLVAINLLITSAFLYKLRHNYHDKDDNTKLKETRYFTITLPSIIALVFLYFGGLQKAFG